MSLGNLKSKLSFRSSRTILKKILFFVFSHIPWMILLLMLVDFFLAVLIYFYYTKAVSEPVTPPVVTFSRVDEKSLREMALEAEERSRQATSTRFQSLQNFLSQ